MRWSTPVLKLAELSVNCIYTNLRPWSEMQMVGQPRRQINLKTNSATEAADLFWRASACFWPFAKEAHASDYVFISSFCFRKGTNEIYPYSMILTHDNLKEIRI